MPIVTRFKDSSNEEFFIDEYGALSVVDEFGTHSIFVAKEDLPEFFEWLKTQVKLDDGWIEWGGGARPVGPCLVDIKRRDGVIVGGTVSTTLPWMHNDSDYDIIAYRVSK